ncbi:MAG: methyl-accepting chemotaxis protein [Bacteroidales bacterium]|nr:methyl-accepting chemotaxis protein [Bacteroidales bacterium]
MNFIKKHSLRLLIFAPFAFVIGYVLISNILVSRMVYQHLDSYATNLAEKKYEAMDSLVSRIQEKQRRACVHMKNSTIFRQVIESRDPFMKFHMDNDRDGFGMRGYFLLTLSGEVLVCDLPELNTPEIKKLIDHILNNGPVTGYDPIIKGGSCLYSADVVEFNGKNIAIIGFVGMLSNDHDFFDALKIEQQIDYLTFDKGKFICSTDAEINSASLPQDIEKACETPGQKWVGEYSASNKSFYTSTISFFSHDSSPSGTILLCIDDSIVREPVSQAIFMFIIIGIVLIIIFVLSVILMRKYIIQPINGLTDEVAVIATGDLHKSISDVISGREIVSLSDSVRNMQGGIKSVVRPIVDLNKVIVNSIQHVTTSSNNISDSANRQAASLEEVSSSMEEMSANIQQNTANSIETNKLAESISKLIADLGETSKKSNEAINDIASDITAINELVNQTNILALNAAVEAARAGEHGKGFAVVAKEVGRLAEQTRTTAQSINNTANNSMSETGRVFDGLNELLPKIESIVKLINEITVASVEQNSGVSQVNSAIVELNKTTQENAANAEELDDNARDLQNMLMRISKAVDVFKI